MDEDSFLQSISERRRMRNDCLSKKLNDLAKKRNVLLDENQITTGTYEDEGNAKRQCMEISHDGGNKENDMEEDIGGTGNQNPHSYPRSQRARLAALANQINEWEDDTWSDSHLKRHFPKLKSKSVTSDSDAFASSCSSSGSTGSAIIEEKISKKVSFHPSCVDNAIEGPQDQEKLASYGIPNADIAVHQNKLKLNEEIASRSPGKEKTRQKVAVWDKAILATLESQGFVKSNSNAKLCYEFSKNTEMESANAWKKSEKSHSSVLQQPANKAPALPVNKAVDAVEDSGTDPAELPLSARKALFEKAFNSNGTKQSDGALQGSLSVAQRAAIFERSGSFSAKRQFPSPASSPRKISPSITAASPKKISPSTSVASPRKISPSNVVPPQKSMSPQKSTSVISSPLKTQILQSPEVIMSPSKSAAIHTQSVQQKLIESSSNRWKQNEIATKSLNERSQEILALRHHWENMTSQSSGNSQEIPQGELYEESCDEQYPYEESEVESNEYDGDQSEDCQTDDPQLESESARSEYNTEGDTSVSSGFTEEAIATCNAMDNILDNAVSIATSIPPLPPPMPILNSFSNVSRVNSNNSTPHASHYQVAEPHRPENREFPQKFASGSEEVPLMHTVSFYRREKQQRRPTPVKTVVHHEDIRSPSPPKVDTLHIIQEKIRALNEEIKAQQTVICQTSQALNLCHSTEEFFGSTEQVEAERLLLIASQKRQAFLNEIQRLKTHGALGSSALDGTGTFIMNNLQLPLKQDFIASLLDGRCGNAVHHFFCLVRYGHQVIVTQMLSTLDGITNGSLCFTNHITLHDLPPDFSVAFEVYALQTKKENLSHDKKYHIKKEHSKMRLNTKGKKNESKLVLPSVSSPGGPNAVRTSSFGVVGYTRFTLQNCQREACQLEKVPFSSPLEGVLKLKMQLHAEHNVSEKGFLTMFEDVSGFGAWHRRWGVLNSEELIFWKYPEDENRKDPILSIRLKQCITGEVKMVSRDVCARSHTFQLVTVRPQAKGDKNTLISRSVNTLTTTKYLLSADTKEERILWCSRLNEALTNVRKWDSQALRPIQGSEDY